MRLCVERPDMNLREVSFREAFMPRAGPPIKMHSNFSEVAGIQ